jgi:hypothetical protein
LIGGGQCDGIEFMLIWQEHRADANALMSIGLIVGL